VEVSCHSHTENAARLRGRLLSTEQQTRLEPSLLRMRTVLCPAQTEEAPRERLPGLARLSHIQCCPWVRTGLCPALATPASATLPAWGLWLHQTSATTALAVCSRGCGVSPGLRRLHAPPTCWQQRRARTAQFNLAAGNWHHAAAHSLPRPQWDGEENGQKLKLVGCDKDSLIRQQRKE